MRSSTSPPPAPKLAYSVDQACQAIAISRSKLYELIADGRIRALKIGARTLIPAESLHALIAEGSRGSRRAQEGSDAV